MCGLCFILAPCAGGAVEGGGYSVQVASYKNIDGAASLIAYLKKQGYDPFSMNVEIPGKGEWKRVCVGKYAGREEALRAGEGLRQRGIVDHFLIIQVAPAVEKPVVHEEKKPAFREEKAKTKIETEADADIETDTGITVHPLSPVLLRKKISSVPVAPGNNVAVGKTVNEKKPRLPKKATTKVVPTVTDTDLRAGALKDFASGRYEDALHKFKQMAATAKDETVLRRMADCHYFLGKEGDTEHLSQAVDAYRKIIRTYPGHSRENGRVTYRLATSYRRMDLQYEALGEFKNAYLRYPESEYTQESLYMMATITCETERFPEAVELFKEYVKRFPEGTHIKEAYFSVGDCYSRMRQFNDADIWYENALKKWPVLEEVPRDALLQLGAHRFQVGRYDDAAQVLFVYLNLFPEGDGAKDALYAIAHSFERTDRPASALKILSLLIERYPGSREAKEGALMMANMGVQNPGIPVPGHILAGMDSYREPIEAYDTMEGTLIDPEMEEEVIFGKTVALIKQGRYREAFDTGQRLLTTFPKGKRREAGEGQLVIAAGHLIDDHYTRGDYLSVADLYFDLDRDLLFEKGGVETLSQIGMSLKELKLLDQAAGFFEDMNRAITDNSKKRALSLEMARIDYERGRYTDAKRRLQTLIDKHPEVDGETVLAARRLMGDIAYAEEFYKEAAGFYSVALGSGKEPEGEMAIRKRYADSLREIGMYASALVNYRRVLTACDGTVGRCPLPVVMHLYEDLGDCLYRKGSYEQAILMYQQSLYGIPEDEQNRWTMANIGRGYVQLRDQATSGDQFVPGRNVSDPFWSRVMDYYQADGDWTDKYGPYIQGS